MATITNSPSTYNFLNTYIGFTLNMTGVDSPTESKLFLYYLKDADGNQITPTLSYVPQEGIDFLITFERDIFSVLYTEPPAALDHAFGNIRTESSMFGEYKLVYWEQTTVKLTCVKTESAEQESSSFYVVNASVVYFDDFFSVENFHVLTHKPRVIYLNKNSNDLMYVFAKAGTINFVATVYTNKGVFLDFMAGSVAVPTDKIVSLNLLPRSLASEATYVDVYVRKDFDDPYFYTIKLVDQCDAIDITYQDYYGGLGVVLGEILDIKQITSQNEIARIIEGRPFTSLMTANKISYFEYRLRITTSVIEDRDTYFYQQLMSSGKYFLHVPDNRNVKRQLPVIANTFEWDEVASSLVAVFKIALPIHQPNSN